MSCELAMTLLETLRFNANRKSDLDRDKKLLLDAADELEEMASEIKRLNARIKQLKTIAEHWRSAQVPEGKTV